MSTRFIDCLAGLPSTTRRFAAGAQLFDRGQAVRHVHVVVSGEVHLLRRQPGGAAFVLQRAGPEAVVGEASIMSELFHCGAEAVTECVVRIWPLPQVRALIASDLATARAYAAHIAGEMREARLRAEIVSLKRVADRLDAWLAWHDAALPEKGRWHHLASELGVSPEALYRELARRRPAA